MPKLFVEPRGEIYVVLDSNGRVQARARTQEKAIEKAHALRGKKWHYPLDCRAGRR
jgi:hypothetical protein